MRLVLMLILIILSHQLSAQNLVFKLSAGASIARPLSNAYLNDQRISAGYGYAVEGGIRYGLNEKLALEGGILYNISRYSVANSNQSAIRTNYQDQFLEIPILLDYRLFTFARTQFGLLAGLYGSYWVKAQADGLYANVFESEWNAENQTEVIALEPYNTNIALDQGYNRFALGFGVGLGAKRPLSKKIAVGLRTTLRQDLTNRLDNSAYSQRYQRFTLEGTLFYHITREN